MTYNFANAKESIMDSVEMLYKYFATDENKFDRSLVQIREGNTSISSTETSIISIITEPLSVIIDFRDNITMHNAMMLIYVAVEAMYAGIDRLYKELENFDRNKNTIAPSLGDVSDIIPIKINYTKIKPFIISFHYDHSYTTIPSQEKLDEYRCLDMLNLSSYIEGIVDITRSKEMEANQLI